MSDFNWNFDDVSSPILLWMFVGLMLCSINICLLFVPLSRYRSGGKKRGCTTCNTMLLIILFISICLNILTLIFMTSNNGVLPKEYADFGLQNDTKYTLNEQMYFILYTLSFNTLNVYCLMIIFISTVAALNTIQTFIHSTNIRLFAALLILLDIIYRIICILLYCTPMTNSKAISISLYSMIMTIYLCFIIFICIARNSASNTDILTFNEDYLFENGLNHLRVLHYVFVIWFIATLSYELCAVFGSYISNVHNTYISLWIELMLSIMVNIVVIYYLIPSTSGAAISDNAYAYSTKDKRFRTQSLSKTLPSWISSNNKHKYDDGYCNINPSLSEVQISSVQISKSYRKKKNSNSYYKAGYIYNKKQKKHSWYESRENIHGTPESSMNANDNDHDPKSIAEDGHYLMKYNTFKNNYLLKPHDECIPPRKATDDLL